MKPKRIAVLDLSALARAAAGSPPVEDEASHECAPTPSRWIRCGTELDHEAHCAELDEPSAAGSAHDPADDPDFLAIEIALDWARANRERTRRTAFERALLRTLQARLRRNGARSVWRVTHQREAPTASRRRR
jgi:hypothetical protein